MNFGGGKRWEKKKRQTCNKWVFSFTFKCFTKVISHSAIAHKTDWLAGGCRLRLKECFIEIPARSAARHIKDQSLERTPDFSATVRRSYLIRVKRQPEDCSDAVGCGCSLCAVQMGLLFSGLKDQVVSAVLLSLFKKNFDPCHKLKNSPKFTGI